MKKKISILLIFVLILSVLTACGVKTNIKEDPVDKPEKDNVGQSDVVKPTEEPTNKPVETPTEDETNNSEELTSSQKVAYDFVKYIQNADYSAALDLLDIKDKEYTKVEDFKWLLPRTEFADIIETDSEIKDVTSVKETLKDVVSLKVGGTSLTVTVVLDDDNNWKVHWTNGIVFDWKLEVPKGTTVFMNAVALSSDMRERSGHVDTYTIPAIFEREQNIVVKSSVYGDFNISAMPQNDKPYTAVCVLNSDVVEDLFEKVKISTNAIFDLGQNGSPESDYNKYISSSASTDLVHTLYAATEDIRSGEYKNVKLVIIEESDKSANPVTLFEDNIVKMDIRTEVQHVQKVLGNGATRLYDSIQIVDNGEYAEFYYVSAGSNMYMNNKNLYTHNWNY